MSPGGRRSNRVARLLAVGALVLLNLCLLALNAQKLGWLGFDDTTGDSAVPVAPGVEGEPRADPSVADGRPVGAATLLSADGAIPTPSTEAAEPDDWPGGHGPVPEGPPARREVLLGQDGTARVVGSTPRWSVALQVVDRIGRRLPGGPAWVSNELTWHPDASDDPGSGVVRLERPLLYDAGEVGLPVGGVEILEPAVGLLTARPDLFVVLVAHVDDLGDTDENAAVALARAVAVAARLEARGIDRSRLMTVVAPSDPDAPPNDGEEARSFNRRIEIRFENLLNPPSVG